MAKRYGVYLMASRPKFGAIYTGMSGNIPERAKQNAGLIEGGAAWALKYKTRRLVYYQIVNEYELARLTEKRMKSWKRKWKVETIEKMNPGWQDLKAELERLLAE